MLGPLLQDFCTTCHIAPETLTDGLCPKSMFQKFAKGIKKPEKLLGDALWQRTGKSIEKFDVLLEYDEFSLAMERTNIQLLIRHNKLFKAQKSIEHYQKIKGGNVFLHTQFLCLQRAEIYRRQGASYEKQMGNLYKGIHQTITVHKLSPNIMETHLFGLLELLLLERYAFLLSEKDPETASCWYIAMERYLTRPAADGSTPDHADSYRLLPILYYHQAMLHTACKEYEPALCALHSGLSLLRQRQSFEPLFLRMAELHLKLLQDFGAAPPASETALLQTLRQELEENGIESLENIYPDYPERNIFSVNDMIRQRRLARGTSEEDMAVTVGCDLRTLKSIESRKQMPQAATKKKFFQEFGLPAWKYCPPMITRTYSFFRENADFITCNYAKEHGRAKEIYEKICKGLNKNELVNHYFIDYWGSVLRYGRGEVSKEQFQDTLSKMLQRTLPEYDAGYGTCLFTKYERDILIELAWNMDKDDRLGIGELLHAQYGKFHDNEALAGLFPEYYMALACCLARFTRLQGKFEEAEEILDGALKQIHFLQDDFQLQHLCLEHFRLENGKREAQELPPAQKEDKACRWMQYAYAVSKYYMQDINIPKHIENYLKKTYGDKSEILRYLQ